MKLNERRKLVVVAMMIFLCSYNDNGSVTVEMMEGRKEREAVGL